MVRMAAQLKGGGGSLRRRSRLNGGRSPLRLGGAGAHSAKPMSCVSVADPRGVGDFSLKLSMSRARSSTRNSQTQGQSELWEGAIPQILGARNAIHSQTNLWEPRKSIVGRVPNTTFPQFLLPLEWSKG